MHKHIPSIGILLFILAIGNTCIADTNHVDNCNLDNDTQQKEELSPPDDIISSILKVPGDIIDGIANIPLNDIVASTLEIPGNAVKFVAEIPYDEIIEFTLEASVEIVEFIIDDGFLLGFFVGYRCCCD